MELIYWEEQRACWVFRGDEDDLFQWEGESHDMDFEKEQWKRRMQEAGTNPVSSKCEAEGRWKSHDCSMDYSQ